MSNNRGVTRRWDLLSCTITLCENLQSAFGFGPVRNVESTDHCETHNSLDLLRELYRKYNTGLMLTGPALCPEPELSCIKDWILVIVSAKEFKRFRYVCNCLSAFDAFCNIINSYKMLIMQQCNFFGRIILVIHSFKGIKMCKRQKMNSRSSSLSH